MVLFRSRKQYEPLAVSTTRNNGRAPRPAGRATSMVALPATRGHNTSKQTGRQGKLARFSGTGRATSMVALPVSRGGGGGWWDRLGDLDGHSIGKSRSLASLSNKRRVADNASPWEAGEGGGPYKNKTPGTSRAILANRGPKKNCP